MSETVLIVLYCLLVVGASLLGGLLPFVFRLTHTRVQMAISLVAGFMLGVAVLHLIPHSFEYAGGHVAALWLLGGFLVMFFAQRFLGGHTHDLPEAEALSAGGQPAAKAAAADHHHHGHEHLHEPHAHATHGGALTWSGAFFGLTIHGLIGGIALASAVAAEAHAHAGPDHTDHDHGFALFGLAVFLVTFLHKPLDSLTIATLSAVAGHPAKKRHLINAAYALAVPAGVVLFYLGFAAWVGDSPAFLGAALAFAAGTFLCISLSDLLPEVHFHSHDRLKLSALLLTGLLLAFGVEQLEHATHADHDHAGHDHAGHDHAGHDHAGHDHAGHDHAGHDHAGHDHAGHDHAGHDHADHDHADDHAGHDH